MMAEKSRKNVVRLKVVDGDRIPPLHERRAAKAFDRLCDAVSSPAAKSSGLSEDEIINAIKQLKLCSLDEPGYWYDEQCTPVWSISSKQELEQVGLDLKEIEGLASILPLGKSSHETDVSDQLIPEILFTLEILDYDEDKFQRFASGLDRYPAVGVLLCEILTNSQLLEKARQFLDRESTDQKRKILLKYLKGKLPNLNNLNIVHFASLCGQYIATIVPKEVNCITLSFTKVSESDATALASVISHSSVVKELRLCECGLNLKSIASLQDGLKNSDVKIRSLNISNNRGIDEEGFRCLGNIVKKHAVEELNMSTCNLSFGKLKLFDGALGNAKIKVLDISDNEDLTVNAICQLSLKVTKHLLGRKQDIRELQDFIHAHHPGGLKVTRSSNTDLMDRLFTDQVLIGAKSDDRDAWDVRENVFEKDTGQEEVGTSSKMSETLDLDDDKPYTSASLESKSKGSEAIIVHGDSRIADDLNALKKDSNIPHITCTQEVGPEGGRILVGDCFIEFQPGTFTKFRKVTVTARIDSSEWPEGDEVITPTLDVNSGKLQKPAKVRLATWVAPDDDQSPNVEVLHFSENKWDIIQIQQLGLSRFIEFQCDSFSPVLARIVGLFSLPISITFQPTLVYFSRTFVTALHLKDLILSNSLLREFAKKNPELVHHNSMSLKKGDKVEISLIPRKSGFVFDPSEPFSQSIDSKLLGGNINRDRFVLESECNAGRITIYFKAGKEAKPHAIDYHWEPDYSKDEDKPCTSTSLDQTSSKPSSYNIKVVGNLNFGGDLNQGSTGRKEDYGGAAIQTLNKGRLETSNKDCTNVMKVSHATVGNASVEE